MRLSNRSKAPFYSFVLTFINFIVLSGIALYVLEVYKFKILGSEKYLLIIIPVLIAIIFVLRGKQIFEYDSDGEAINFKNRNIIPFLDKVVSDEFPKYKIQSYQIINFYIVKRLYISISSKKKNSITLKYDISYLKNKEVSDLRFSLNKVVQNNRQKEKSILTK